MLKGILSVAVLMTRNEMSRFIDCLVSTAKEIGVETRPQEELDELIKEWSVKDDSKNKEDKT